jgi:hypothetical protein
LRRHGYYDLLRWPFRVSWGYNPVSSFLARVFERRGYWWPRRVRFDDYAAKDCGWKRSDPHSWYLVVWSFKRMLRTLRWQRWGTWEAFKAEKDPKCPHCGANNFDVD